MATESISKHVRNSDPSTLNMPWVYTHSFPPPPQMNMLPTPMFVSHQLWPHSESISIHMYSNLYYMHTACYWSWLHIPYSQKFGRALNLAKCPAALARTFLAPYLHIFAFSSRCVLTVISGETVLEHVGPQFRACLIQSLATRISFPEREKNCQLFSGECTGILLEVLVQCIIYSALVASRPVPWGLILAELNLAIFF